MISNMKRYVQVAVIGGLVAGSAALGATSSADEGEVPFEVGATDLAGGGIPVPEYPTSGGAITDSYDGIGETDLWVEANEGVTSNRQVEQVAKAGFTDMSAGGLPEPDEFRGGSLAVYIGIGETDQSVGIVGFRLDRDGSVTALESIDTGSFVLLQVDSDLRRGGEALSTLDSQLTFHCPAETEDEVRYAEQTFGLGREALSALDRNVIAARSDLTTTAGAQFIG